MKSTHRLFHVIITTSAFAVGCGGGSPAPQEPAGTPAVTAAHADGDAGKKAAGNPKAKDGSTDKDDKAAKPPAKMGVTGW